MSHVRYSTTDYTTKFPCLGRKPGDRLTTKLATLSVSFTTLVGTKSKRGTRSSRQIITNVEISYFDFIPLLHVATVFIHFQKRCNLHNTNWFILMRWNMYCTRRHVLPFFFACTSPFIVSTSHKKSKKLSALYVKSRLIDQPQSCWEEECHYRLQKADWTPTNKLFARFWKFAKTGFIGGNALTTGLDFYSTATPFIHYIISRHYLL